MRAIGLIVSCVLAAVVAESNWIRVQVDGTTQLFSVDGVRQRAALAAPPQGQLSPDGTRVLRVVEQSIHIGSADGKDARPISPHKMISDWPSWSPDGKRIAFVGLRDGHWQVHFMDTDGGNIQQLTDVAEGVWRPQFGPDGSLAYLAWRQPIGKLQPSDLLVFDGRTTRQVANGVYINDYAWSPNGKTIAYSKLGSLVFHDLKSGAEQEIAFADIDQRLRSHVAAHLSWRPDGQALACTITFLGGRQNGGPKIFGDHEVFVIPRRGKPTWFQTDGNVEQIDWAESPQPAKDE